MPPNPVRNLPILMPTLLESWRTGVSWWGFLMVSMDPQGHKKHQLLSTLLPEMPQNPPKLCQEPTRPYAYPVGVVEDRSVLMGVPDGLNGPTGSQGIIVVKQTPHRNASKPLQTLSGTYSSLWLFSWSCGGQECPDGVPGGHNQTANCLRSILSFYRPQKAFKTPKI